MKKVVVPAEARAHLARDSVMRSLIDSVGPLEYTVDSDLWKAVVGSIVGQQLSVRAAATIRARVAALGDNGFPAPETILAIPEERLRACGLSRAKLDYVRSAARCWIDGEMDPESIVRADDEEAIQTLMKLRGVGRWTAEMVLIFCLGRPDVLAVDDLGLRAATEKVYGLPTRPDRDDMMRIGEAWKPYRSFASLYLWRSLQP